MVVSPQVQSIRAEIPAAGSLICLNTSIEIVEDLARGGPPRGDFPTARIESETMNEL